VNNKMTQPRVINAVLIGAGQRGMDAYGSYALEHPEELNIIAVAEPDSSRRATFSTQHNIPTEFQFDSWKPLLKKPRLGETAIICTQDQLHTKPTLASLHSGYHVLLEKPMAPTMDECKLLVKTAGETHSQLHICHVLRYTEHFQKLKEIIKSGILGEIVNISHRENVSWWHMAHSFVRGNWRNSIQSVPMILTKCCHDLDILIWLLEDKVRSLSSVGKLHHFRSENAPLGAARRCLDDCPIASECRYFAPFIYIDHTPLLYSLVNAESILTRYAVRTYLKNPHLIRFLSRFILDLKYLGEYRGWPNSAVTLDPTPENLLKALKDGPYGRCVYYCDNNVVDHQVVSMDFERGTSVTLTMHGHSHIEGRTTRIEGTSATLTSAFSLGSSWIEVNEHLSDQVKRYNTTTSARSGHGGGDHRLVAGFLKAIREGSSDTALTSAHTSLESHLMAFAAEEARLENKTINMDLFR
jgi:predicted dehydrogenase